MPIFGDKPYTSITVKVNQLCATSTENESIELHLGDLLSLINLQPSTGASEAARAIRKKIKHGVGSEAYQAVSLLELLVLNGGLSLGRSLARDERLVTVLRNVVQGLKSGNGPYYEADVVKKTRSIAIGWKSELRDLDGLQPLAHLYKSIPKTTRSLRHEEDTEQVFTQTSRRQSPRTLHNEEYEVTRPKPSAPPRPKTMSPVIRRDDPIPTATSREDQRRKKKSKNGRKQAYADSQFKIPQINYKVEAPKIRATLGDCQTHAAGLNNALLTLPLEGDASVDPDVQTWFKKCRTTRRAILRYLQYVGAGNLSEKLLDVRELDEEFLGSLIAANDQLVAILTKFDRACGINADKNYGEPSSEESDGDFFSSESESDDEEYDKRPPKVPSLNESPPLRPISDFRKPEPMDLKTLTSDNPFGDP